MLEQEAPERLVPWYGDSIAIALALFGCGCLAVGFAAGVLRTLAVVDQAEMAIHADYIRDHVEAVRYGWK